MELSLLISAIAFSHVLQSRTPSILPDNVKGYPALSVIFIFTSPKLNLPNAKIRSGLSAIPSSGISTAISFIHTKKSVGSIPASRYKILSCKSSITAFPSASVESSAISVIENSFSPVRTSDIRFWTSRGSATDSFSNSSFISFAVLSNNTPLAKTTDEMPSLWIPKRASEMTVPPQLRVETQGMRYPIFSMEEANSFPLPEGK